jgi:hypothetical protein
MKRKILTIVAAALFALTPTAACGKKARPGDGLVADKVDITLTERARFDNMFTEAFIPEQWEEYGVGDPYVLRYNGEYYLYVSTKNGQWGYKVWKSHDLIHYEYLGRFDLQGMDGTNTAHRPAFAPEVYYYDGDFYMYSSPDGAGHYIYKSVDKTPYGVFKAVTGNLGLKIDGSVFFDDDEKMYFFRADDGGIVGYEMPDPEHITENTRRALHAPLVKWVEGPCVIKRDGVYYLTYTGNHVKSAAYRVDYSYATDSPLSANYRYPQNNSLLLNTLTKHNGLGHSTGLLGPDLDSYYIAYHSLQTSAGPVRQYNLNRLSFTDNRMSVYGPTEKGAMVPVMPDFYALKEGSGYAKDDYAKDLDHALVSDGASGLLLSNKSHGRQFSAEYTFSSMATDGSAKLIFGYDGANYHYVTVNGKTIEVHGVTEVGDVKLTEGTLVKDWNFNVAHAIRIAYKEGRLNVWFDNMRKIDVPFSGVGAGKIGYGGFAENGPGTTTFSNVSFGSSEKIEPAVVEGDFWAANCYPGEQGSYFGGDGGVKKLADDINDDRLIYADSSSLEMKNAGDFAVYTLDVLEDGLYGLESLFANADAGSQISVQFGGDKPLKFTLPSVNYDANADFSEENLLYAKHNLGEVRLKKGLTTMKVKLISGSYDAVSYSLFRSSEKTPEYENDLSGLIQTGANYMTLWKIKNDGERNVHYSTVGANNMLLFGKDTMTDYTVSVKIRINLDQGNAASGLIVRAQNPSIFAWHVDECSEGYLINFNNMQLAMYRINYNSQTVAAVSMDIERNKYHDLKAVCKGNNIKVYFDGEFMFEYTDPYPFSHGAVALYNIGAESYWKDLKITGA